MASSSSAFSTASAVAAITSLASSTLSAAASAASSAASASAPASVSSALANDTSWGWGDSPELAGAIGAGNGTVLPVDAADGEGSYALNTFIGLLIVVVASLFNALGLNLTKLDHTQQQRIAKRERRPPWMRLMWLAGMGIYISVSERHDGQDVARLTPAVGSPLALRYLRPDWVAPLGASSLVFNFLFARWLVGTPVTATDIRGTALIVLGVILILVFSSINHGLTQSLPVSRLDALWSRASWLAYFLILVPSTALVALFARLLAALLKSRASFSPLPSPTLPTASRARAPAPGPAKRVWAAWRRLEHALLGRLEHAFVRTDDVRLTWLQGIGWAVCGGSLAGLCLVFTKAVVKISGLPGHPFVHFSSIITTVLVIATAVLQIVCLNKALQCADTVVVVPLFYAVFGFVNSLIFYAEVGQFARWVLVAVFLSIAVLISGVVLLSLKQTPEGKGTVSAEPASSVRLHPRSRAGAGAGKGGGESEGEDEADVMWEVGSASDAGSDDEDGGEGGKGGAGAAGAAKGVGGTRGGGERGLLLQAEDEAEGSGARAGESGQAGEAGGAGGASGASGASAARREGAPGGARAGSGSDDEFGEYEAVRPDEA